MHDSLPSEPSSALLFEKTSPLPVSPGEVYRWHMRPGAFQRLMAPWRSDRVLEGSDGIEEGSRSVLEIRKGGLRFRWVAEHRNVVQDQKFEDHQVEGPFRYWRHEHGFEPRADGGTLLRDRIHYLPPGGAVGRKLASFAMNRDFERLFTYRHATTRADLELHSTWRERPPLTVAISGASGLVGSALAALLTTGGHRVIPLVRGSARASGEAARWDPERGLLDPERIEGIDAVVHLAGENVAAGRWTAARKRRIRDSRVEGTRSLVRSLAELDRPPGIFACASAIGYLGDTGASPVEESAPPGSGFLAEVCRDWEAEAAAAEEFGARVVCLRFGVVLSPAGGALAKMLPAFRLGVGGPLGSGDQFVSWVSLDDAISAVLQVLQDASISGPVHVTAPHPVPNRRLTAALAETLSRPGVLPMPAPAARALFGEMANETLLSSTRAVPAALTAAGYRFRHVEIEAALRHLLGR